jgi:LCP family protein required for cell wall assembly
MTLVLPGSAQLVSGSKRIGRIALRAWGLLWLLALVAVGVGLVDRTLVFDLAASPTALIVGRTVLWAMAAGWTFLFVDAWRLGSPGAMGRGSRIVMVGLSGVLAFAVAATLLFAGHLFTVQRDFIATTFGSHTVTPAADGRYNVLLLGGDSGKTRWGLRPDSITVASIDANTGRTVLFGLPRNMLNFPFPEGSPMHKYFPNGYDCGTDCELNSLVTWTENHPKALKGYEDPGAEATIEAVEGVTGLKINYYAMVNLQGFRSLVDAVGGITLNVRSQIPIGKTGDITGYVQPGVRHLDGYQALWFARSRANSDDYSRMARQKCVMNAMLQQLNPQTVVLKYQQITSAGSSLVTTNLPASELGRFIDLALKARSQRLATVSFVPPAINPANPNIAKIQSMVQKAIDKSGPAGAATPGKGFNTQDKASTVGGSVGDIQKGYAANKSGNLSKVC